MNNLSFEIQKSIVDFSTYLKIKILLNLNTNKKGS